MIKQATPLSQLATEYVSKQDIVDHARTTLAALEEALKGIRRQLVESAMNEQVVDELILTSSKKHGVIVRTGTGGGVTIIKVSAA